MFVGYNGIIVFWLITVTYMTFGLVVSSERTVWVMKDYGMTTIPA
jgi:hypothetical protein